MDHAISQGSSSAYSDNHITSSPHYPQSSGLAEKYVQIVRSLFYTAKEEGKELLKCLMIYCNAPLQAAYSYQCKSYKAEAQDLVHLCQMLLENSSVYILKNSETLINIKICLCMIYILVKM